MWGQSHVDVRDRRCGEGRLTDHLERDVRCLRKGHQHDQEEGRLLARAGDHHLQGQHGTSITVDNAADGGPDLLTKIRASGVARKGPDLATVWSGTYLLSVKDYLAPLSDQYPTDKRAGIVGWEAVSEGLVDGGKLYGVPCGTDSLTCLYYNTKVLKKAGVSVDTDKVQEWEEFIGMLDKIKATGVTPLALNLTSYIYFTLLYWIAQQVGGSPGIVDLGNGKRKFASPEVQTAVDRWVSLKPYANAGVPVTKSDANMKQMLQSKAGIMSGANLADLRVGLGQSVSITKLPNITTDAPLRDSGIGGPGQAFVIPAASKNVDARVGFIKFLNSPDQQLRRAKLNGGPLPNVPDLVGTDVFPDPLAKKLATWSTGKFVFRPDNTLDANLISDLAAQAQLVWNGNITSAQFLEQLDKKRDQILSGA